MIVIRTFDIRAGTITLSFWPTTEDYQRWIAEEVEKNLAVVVACVGGFLVP